MTGYRVAEEPDDPFAVDEEACADQVFMQQLVAHGAISAVTVGLWLPGMLIWLIGAKGRARKKTAGYRVRVQSGVLTAGNASNAVSIPLDTITNVSVNKGKVSVAVLGGKQPIFLYGLRDPMAAVEVILEARRSHMTGVGPARRVVVDEAHDVVGVQRSPREREAG